MSEEMPRACESFASRLIDDLDDARRDPAVCQHLTECPHCRELVESLAEVAPVLLAAGREEDPALIERLHRRARAAQTQPTPSPGWWEIALGVFLRPRVQWGLAGTLACVITVLLTLNYLSHRPLGQVVYTTAALEVGGVPAATDALPVVRMNQALRAGDGLSLILLDSGGALALNADSEIEFLSPSEIRIGRGEIALWAPIGQQITLQFGRGFARGEDTVFCFNLIGEWPKVDVSHGEVDIIFGGNTAHVEAGESAILNYGSGFAQAPRVEGDALPAWAASLLNDASLDAVTLSRLDPANHTEPGCFMNIVQ